MADEHRHVKFQMIDEGSYICHKPLGAQCCGVGARQPVRAQIKIDHASTAALQPRRLCLKGDMIGARAVQEQNGLTTPARIGKVQHASVKFEVLVEDAHPFDTRDTSSSVGGRAASLR